MVFCIFFFHFFASRVGERVTRSSSDANLLPVPPRTTAGEGEVRAGSKLLGPVVKDEENLRGEVRCGGCRGGGNSSGVVGGW